MYNFVGFSLLQQLKVQFWTKYQILTHSSSVCQKNSDDLSFHAMHFTLFLISLTVSDQRPDTHLLTPTREYQYQTFSSICNSTIISSARQSADPCSCHERRAQKPRAEKQMRKKSGNIQHKAELWGRKVSVYGVMELSRQQYPRPLDPSPPPNASPQRSAGTEQQGCLMWLHNRGFHCRSVCGSDPCCIQPI